MACVADLPGMDFDPTNAPSLMGEAAPLFYSWRDHAKAAQAAGNPFEAFIFNWIALNGWAERATELERDAEWIRALANSRQLRDNFEALKTDRKFSDTLDRFADFWPIMKASQQRRSGISLADDRKRAIALSLTAGVAHEPQCFLLHDRQPPRDWPHALHTLYRVRNNLFHGEKGAWIDADWQIVDAAGAFLAAYIARSMILGY